MTIRIGLVGTGFAAGFHFESYNRVEKVDCQVVGAYSRSAENRSEFCSARDIKPFESFEQMLEEVDVVDVVTPGYAHEPYVVRAAEAGKHVIVEKPFTGYFGPEGAGDDWRGDRHPKQQMLDGAVASCRRMVEACRDNNVKLMYAENWVYAPTVQKEVEILKATKGQILWMQAEESHSGSHSPAYGIWAKSGGGSMMGKACHPLSAALYLKAEEGKAVSGKPVRPKTVTSRCHRITGHDAYRDEGHLRTDYYDVEDFAALHVIFEDGTVADVFASEIVMGGVHNWIEVMANNHRMRCNINPIDANVLYNPVESALEDVYITEKLGTKQGWSFPGPDEDRMQGYPQEVQDFMTCIAEDRDPLSDAVLACDTIAVIYAAYLSDERKGGEVEVPLIDI